MHRLYKYKYIMDASLISKQPAFNKIIPAMHLKVVAGLYKPASLKLEHSLILASLSSQMPIFGKQAHGKRKKRTLSLNNNLDNLKSLISLDKIVHELLPRVPDFLTPKIKRTNLKNYSFKLRQKFPPLPDFEELISTQLHNEYGGIFLPLHVHFLFSNSRRLQKHSMLQYLKMFRLPFSFYSKRPAPAFDDPIVIVQNF